MIVRAVRGSDAFFILNARVGTNKTKCAQAGACPGSRHGQPLAGQEPSGRARGPGRGEVVLSAVFGERTRRGRTSRDVGGRGVPQPIKPQVPNLPNVPNLFPSDRNPRARTRVRAYVRMFTGKVRQGSASRCMCLLSNWLACRTCDVFEVRHRFGKALKVRHFVLDIHLIDLSFAAI